MKSRKWRVIRCDKDAAAGRRVFSNVHVPMLRGCAINLGGICSFTEALLGEILPVKHQRQALLP